MRVAQVRMRRTASPRPRTRRFGATEDLLQSGAMSAGSKNCGTCGHPNSIDAMFCSKCGAKLPSRDEVEAARALPTSPPAEPTPVPPAKAREETTTHAPRRRVAGAAKTMLGWQPGQEPAPDAPPSERAEAETATSAEPAAESPARRVAGSARTMLGMPVPDAQAIEEAVRQAKSGTAARASEERAATARGLGDAAEEAQAHAAAPAPNDSPARGGRDKHVAGTNRTMLGQPAPKVDAPKGDLGEDDPEPRDSDPGARERARAVYPTNSDEEEALTLPKKRSGGLAIAMIVVGVLALIGGGVALAVILSSGSDLRASVVQGEEGEMLEIEVPGAPSGTRVRFRGAEVALEAGRARFPLSAEDLALGHNELAVDVLGPDGSIESETIALELEMRVRADLGPLASAPPAIDVVVEVPPGSEVTLDGEALELDAQGRATHRVPIDGAGANAEGIVEHVVRYRVVPPQGDAAQGELRTRIPLTTMQIDRPGSELVTDATEIEVAGAVAPGSTVTVGGDAVAVSLGRFLTTRPLPSVGEHTIEVIASAQGKAPRVERIVVRRVADLEAEAARFEVNRELTYARIAPDPTTYRGQKVELIGTVYNVDVSGGRSVIQILVEGCAEGARCPLWVTYPAVTSAALNDRIRVLGTVSGEQQFRSQSGEVRTVPRVDATYVLAAPAPAPRRR